MTDPVLTPRCAAERWAQLVLNACSADSDLKTLNLWARSVGVSRTSLCDSCRMVQVEPREARDLARILRACRVAAKECVHLESILDVRDSRTLVKLLSKAGLKGPTPTTSSLTFVLEHQQFVAADNDGLRALRRLVECSEIENRTVHGRSSSSGGHRDIAPSFASSHRLGALPVEPLRIEPAAKWLRKH